MGTGTRSKSKKATRDRDLTLQRIAEVTLALIQEKGIERLSLEEIARRCGVSRPLLNHYFKESGKAGLMAHVFETVLEDLKIRLDTDLANTRDPDKLLEVYVHSHFAWGRENPSRITALLLFFSKCSSDDVFRSINTRSAEFGRQRIELMLRPWIREAQPLRELARGFQLYLTGAIISYFTEDKEKRRALLPERLVLEHLKLYRTR